MVDQSSSVSSWNVKYKLGESEKLLKQSTHQVISRYQSSVGSRISTDVSCLRSTVKQHRAISRQLNRKRQHEEDSPFAANPDDLPHQIIAKKSFFLNPHRNDPKIIKAKNKLYVI